MYCSMIRFSLMLLLSLQSSTTICSFRPSAAALLVRPRSSPFLVSINSSTAPAVRHQHSGSTTIPPLRSQSKAHDSKTTGDTISSSSSNTQQQPRRMAVVPLLRSEGLFAVNKPLEWTSQDAVAYIRGILERDARNRGARPAKVTSSRRNKGRVVRVGHGGTLDPLATGVLVIGVGKGTKELQSYLQGAKRYRAGAELGFETTTLDMEGNVTKTAPFDHVTREAVEEVLANELTGTIQQIPPIFSAIRKDGKRLYKEARAGKSAEDVEIEPRQVEVLSIKLLEFNLPKFEVDVLCGGGTYVRSLVRDIGYKVNSVATTTYLERTQQGQFKLEDTLSKDDWSADNIYAAIDRLNAQRQKDKKLDN